MPIWLIVTLLAIAGIHSLVASRATLEKSTTSDELAHITGGYTYNKLNDYRFHPENGFLPQRWHALPAALSGEVRFRGPESEHWPTSHVWLMGYEFFYKSGNDLDWILSSARAMNSLFGFGVVLLVAGWAYYLFGPAGSVLAAIFSAASPTMLAHGGLATSDMAMTLFLLGSMTAWWWHLHDGRKRVWLLSAFTFALACVAKFTAVILPLMLVLAMLVRIASPAPYSILGRTFETRGGKFASFTLSLIGHGLVAVVVIWAFCGFRYSAFNPDLPGGHFIAAWEHVLSIGRLPAGVIQLCRDWHLLPEGYLYGLAYTIKSLEARSAFLDGAYSLTGWAEFFPKAFLYKTAPSLFAALGLGTILALLGSRTAGRDKLRRAIYFTCPLLILFAGYWLMSLTSRLNIGHRHILPTYPVLFIFCGVLGWAALRAWRSSRGAGALLYVAAGLLTGWHAVIAAKIHPHHLAYFSPLVGGPSAGYRHLVDSSLDWGQDLPGLKQWLDANRQPGERVFLSYFGSGEPDYYGIESTRLPGLFDFRRVHPWYWPEPGIYAISATMLVHVYSPLRGDWTAEFEQRYQQLRQHEGSFRALKQSPNGHPELMQSLSPTQWQTAWEEFNHLRFARLAHYLRAREPDAHVGYSILLYRLTQADLDVAVNGTLHELAAAVERGGTPSR